MMHYQAHEIEALERELIAYRVFVSSHGLELPAVLDGPQPPDAFAWKGKVYEGLPTIPWRLVDVLWRSRFARDIQDLALPVWHDDAREVTPNMIGGARKFANAFFIANGLPHSIETKAGYVTLKKGR